MSCSKLCPKSIIIILFLSLQTFASEQIPDTIELNKLKEDTTKVNLLLKLYKETIWSDVKRSQQYANDALQLSQKLEYDKGIAYSNYSLALIFVDYDFTFSEELILVSLQYAEKIGDSLFIAKIENTIGQLKNNQEQYQAALLNFEKSLQFFFKTGNDSLAAAVYNNIAISYKNAGNDTLALENYYKAAEINERIGNLMWLANNYYNLGNDYLEIGDTVKGKEYLNKSFTIASEQHMERILPYILFSFGWHYMENKNYNKAKSFAFRALSANQEQLNRVMEKNVLILLKEIYFQLSKYDSAYIFQEKIIAINDSIKKDTQLSELDLLEMKYNFQEQILQNELKTKTLEAQHERKESTYIIVILIIGIILLAFVLLFFIQRNHIRQKSLEQKAIKLENEKLENELEFKKKELTTNVMYLMKKNEFITDLSKKLQSIKDAGNLYQDKIISDVINELDKNSSVDIWTEFETRFQEIYGDFYNRISLKFPSLTPNDMKLCAFLKLNMSSKDISAITFQSADSLKIARHRLRKKLGLNRDDNLVTFLNQI